MKSFQNAHFFMEVALDWLARSDVVENEDIGIDELHQDTNTPIVIVIPGLTSDSDSVYIKHLTFYMAKRGWNVVVSNHRGLGEVPLTSDFFYTGGWTNDLRKVVEHIRSQSPDVPLFVVGTSLGANMMVKYLGIKSSLLVLRIGMALKSALDDPVCTKEALIWDECRVNKNIILATTQHGGHLGYFDGMDAKGVWWVRAVDEFLTILGSSTMIRRQNKMPDSMLISPQKSLVNKDPYIGYVKKTENQIHVDNLPKMTKKSKITDAQGSETSSRIDSIIFFLKRSWISFSKRKI
nr:embryogenesis-associated protein EMB8-like [Tanacetum cinerariifolium]